MARIKIPNPQPCTGATSKRAKAPAYTAMQGQGAAPLQRRADTCGNAHDSPPCGEDICPPQWRTFVPFLCEGRHLPIVQKVQELRATHTIYPQQTELFAALAATPPQNVRVVILGQDPYHGPGQAHGLAFSVREGCPTPRSLGNIFKEIQDDVYGGAPLPDAAPCLTRWAHQGVLLLNTVLSVTQGTPHSHARLGWQEATRALLTALAAAHPLAVLLWGKPAQEYAPLFPTPPHLVLQAAHPSPLSAHRGFFGCKHFSRVNAWLTAQGLSPIRW